MTRLFTSLMSISLLTFLIAIAGCGADSDDTTGDDKAQTSSSNHDGHEHTDHASDGSTAMDKMKAELAKLSPEDAASAEKQHMCRSAMRCWDRWAPLSKSR